MKVQVQVNGSNRSEDVVEALQRMLPDASGKGNEITSIIVFLDWSNGHLAGEVEEEIRSRGHVLLFHGGGVHTIHPT